MRSKCNQKWKPLFRAVSHSGLLCVCVTAISYVYWWLMIYCRYDYSIFKMSIYVRYISILYSEFIRNEHINLNQTHSTSKSYNLSQIDGLLGRIRLFISLEVWAHIQSSYNYWFYSFSLQFVSIFCIVWTAHGKIAEFNCLSCKCIVEMPLLWYSGKIALRISFIW